MFVLVNEKHSEWIHLMNLGFLYYCKVGLFTGYCRKLKFNSVTKFEFLTKEWLSPHLHYYLKSKQLSTSGSFFLE